MRDEDVPNGNGDLPHLRYIQGALKIATGPAVYHPPGNLRVGALLLQWINVNVAGQGCFRVVKQPIIED